MITAIQSLGARPEYRRQGIARQLMQAGLKITDATGQDIYLEATDMAKGMYEQLGFEVLKVVELMPGYKQTAMLRKAVRVEAGEPADKA